MSTGRRDYTWGFLNEAVGVGRYRSSFSEYYASSIGSGIVSKAYTYTVPVNYRLGVSRIYLSSSNGVYNNFHFEKNGITMGSSDFTGVLEFTLSDVNPVYFEAGDILDIYIQNNEEYNTTFYGGVIGIIESVI